MSEDVKTATLTVELSAAATEQVTVAYAATTWAATSDDYALPAGTLTLATGEKSKVGAWGAQE